LVFPSPSPVQSSASGDTDKQISVRVRIQDQEQTMNMADYLFGVVAAEMPASFPEEALKAQAIAARTFALHRMRSSADGASLSDDPDTCSAYISEQQARAGWGDNADAYVEKIKKAVAETDGMVILYQSEPILAVFHSTSSGMTERAADVWGGSVPYLQSVDSPHEDVSPRYYGKVDVSPEEFKKAFLTGYSEADLSGDPSQWFGGSVLSEAGGVKQITVGGVSVSGGVIRSMCALNSNHFTVSYENGMLVFRTVGFGHGVGMSQYGARGLANEGKTCEEILKWYYTGVSIQKINPDDYV